MEPFKVRRWRLSTRADLIPFFTCARPGRSKGRFGNIADLIVDKWVNGLPGPKTAIISLLGNKSSGTSEYSFYSFHGKSSFQEWLANRHAALQISVYEHPTTDGRKVPAETLGSIGSELRTLLGAGHTVVLVDSGGEQRSHQVCKGLGFIEDTRKI